MGAIGAWFVKIMLSWLWTKLPELVSAVANHLKRKKKAKKTAETAEKYEKVVENGDKATREERKNALKDALNSAGE